MHAFDSEKIQAKLLTSRRQELVGIVGLSAALTLVEIRGGIRLSVPTRVKPEHWLVQHIGLEALKKLVDYYKGEEIEIDRCVRALSAIKEQQILQESAQGCSNAQLARKYGYTERGMRKLRRRVEKTEPTPQIDLFE
ncbi:MAG: hypothetical protein GQ532_18315 [Methylomarinum sp.]|nr:hypothetical protein [Methylomarinum sp.]